MPRPRCQPTCDRERGRQFYNLLQVALHVQLESDHPDWATIEEIDCRLLQLEALGLDREPDEAEVTG